MIYNLTPHSIEVFAPEQFSALEMLNPTTWVADSVEGTPMLSLPSKGIARIKTETIRLIETRLPGVTVKTQYGELTGLPEGVEKGDILIVFLPTLSMAHASGHPLAGQMVAPYQVVRSRENGSLVLGCMGFTF